MGIELKYPENYKEYNDYPGNKAFFIGDNATQKDILATLKLFDPTAE